MRKNIWLAFIKNTKYIFFTFFFVATTQISFGQKKISKQELTEDFAQVKSQLEKLHLGLYHYETRADFEKRYTETLDNLPDSVSTQEAYRAINKLITGMQDLHTSVFVPKSISTKTKNKSLPIQIRRNGEKIYVHLNGSSDSTILRGQELVSIDHVPVNEIFEKSKMLWGTDKGNQNSKKFYSERYFGRTLSLIYGLKDSLTAGLRNPKNDSIYFRKIATELPKNFNKTLAKRYKNISRKNLSFKIIDSLNHVAFMDVMSFSEKANKLDFNHFRFKRLIKRNFKAIEKNQIEHLIVDFRFNGGGLVSNTKSITKYVAPGSFKLMDSTKMTKTAFRRAFPAYSGLPYIIGRLLFKKQPDGTYLNVSRKPHKPSKKHHYDSKIYVLTDGGSYSATVLTIGLWKDMRRATFIGTSPGGGNWGSFAGKWRDLKLKNSKIKVHIPLMKFVHAQPNKVTKTFFVEPDYYVEQSFEDFIQRKDTPLNFVMELIKNK